MEDAVKRHTLQTPKLSSLLQFPCFWGIQRLHDRQAFLISSDSPIYILSNFAFIRLYLYIIHRLSILEWLWYDPFSESQHLPRTGAGLKWYWPEDVENPAFKEAEALIANVENVVNPPRTPASAKYGNGLAPYVIMEEAWNLRNSQAEFLWGCPSRRINPDIW